ncbi:MAG: hypothetical protein AAFN77_09705 [Planctomycetota bacterium]
MGYNLPVIAVVTRETRLQHLKSRWVTFKQAAFRLSNAASNELERRRQSMKTGSFDEVRENMLADAHADDDDFLFEDNNYQQAVMDLNDDLDLGYPVTQVNRQHVANFDFGRCLAVVVIGQDGLVANTAKYVGDLPIIGINPDPTRHDGVLLPFSVGDARRMVQRVIKNSYQTKSVTLAEVNTNDGQRMLAFNDFYVGAKSHVSARYTLEYDGEVESQSSSGVLVATGAGSTGWLSSVFNMFHGMQRFFGQQAPSSSVQMNWSDGQLFWAVREPFISRHSSAGMTAGFLNQGNELVIGSQMGTEGVIFSDGIESDYIEFNAGTIARFSVSRQKAHLVVA